MHALAERSSRPNETVRTDAGDEELFPFLDSPGDHLFSISPVFVFSARGTSAVNAKRCLDKIRSTSITVETLPDASSERTDPDE